MNVVPPLAPDRLEGWADSPGQPAPPRPWRDRLADAFRGIKLGMRGHSSFSVHFFFATLASAAAIVLQCSAVEWALVVACGGLVWIAQLFNSAWIKLFEHLEPAIQERARPTLLIASGAVLIASIAAVVVGSLMFLPKLSSLLFHP